MKKKSKIIKAVLIIIVIVLFLVAFVLAFKYFYVKSPEKNSEKESTKTTDESTSTSSEQTTTNEESSSVLNENKIYYVKTTGSVLNIRSGPGTNYDKISELMNGQSVEVIEKNGEWAKINHNGTVGWVSSKYLSDTPVIVSTTEDFTGQFIVKTDGSPLNIRSGPGTQHNIIGQLKNGQSVEVISKSGSWVQIRFNGSTGWIASNYITDRPATTTQAPNSEKTTKKSSETTTAKSGGSSKEKTTTKNNYEAYVEEVQAEDKRHNNALKDINAKYDSSISNRRDLYNSYGKKCDYKSSEYWQKAYDECYEEIRNLERKLAMRKMDTSGRYNEEIKQLESEIREMSSLLSVIRDKYQNALKMEENKYLYERAKREKEAAVTVENYNYEKAIAAIEEKYGY